MPVFRQYIAPLVAVLIFALALFVVSARIFLPTDMLAPAPIGDLGELVRPTLPTAAIADLPPPLSALVRGLPDDLGESDQLSARL
jgi:hypothetical protein